MCRTWRQTVGPPAYRTTHDRAEQALAGHDDDVLQLDLAAAAPAPVHTKEMKKRMAGKTGSTKGEAGK